MIHLPNWGAPVSPVLLPPAQTPATQVFPILSNQTISLLGIQDKNLGITLNSCSSFIPCLWLHFLAVKHERKFLFKCCIGGLLYCSGSWLGHVSESPTELVKTQNPAFHLQNFIGLEQNPRSYHSQVMPTLLRAHAIGRRGNERRWCRGREKQEMCSQVGLSDWQRGSYGLLVTHIPKI